MALLEGSAAELACVLYVSYLVEISGPEAPLDLERGLCASHMEHAYDFYKPCGFYPLVRTPSHHLPTSNSGTDHADTAMQILHNLFSPNPLCTLLGSTPACSVGKG
jgi:hypothetical protein